MNYNLSFQPDADPNAIATFDQIRSIITGVSPRQDINTARMFTYAGFVSYVTGAHNFKMGVQVRTGWSQELFETRGDIVQIVNNGVAAIGAAGEQLRAGTRSRASTPASTSRTRGRSAA